jgi:hypothetical protein
MKHIIAMPPWSAYISLEMREEGCCGHLEVEVSRYLLRSEDKQVQGAMALQQKLCNMGL